MTNNSLLESDYTIWETPIITLNFIGKQCKLELDQYSNYFILLEKPDEIENQGYLFGKIDMYYNEQPKFRIFKYNSSQNENFDNLECVFGYIGGTDRPYMVGPETITPLKKGSNLENKIKKLI